MLAIYRKYRPTKFGEVLGQEFVVKILKEAAKQKRLAHAYLFAGPRGTGKTTIARLIAKIANCEKSNVEPCNSCVACKSIDEGASLDVVEIDGASNRGIDEIRDLKENARTAPINSKNKVFIIDEAHMLTAPAFNALLKTLEEPPENVIIILATTEIEKIPATISSRTQKFQLQRISIKQIVEKLKMIAVEEKIKISSEALELVSSSAEGSLRDAESLLEQLTSFNDKNITLKEVEDAIGKVGFDKIAEFAEILLKKELKSVLKKLSEINNQGYNLAQFTKDLIQNLRKTAVLKYNPEMKTFFENEMMAEHIGKLTENAKIFGDNGIALMKNLINAYSQMRYSQFPIIPLEVAIIESLKNDI